MIISISKRLKASFLFMASVTKTAQFLLPDRELFAVGATIGQVFIGFMVSVKKEVA